MSKASDVRALLETRREDKAERQALRALKTDVQGIIDATQADVDALDGAQLAGLRAAAKNQRRLVTDLSRVALKLIRLVGGNND